MVEKHGETNQVGGKCCGFMVLPLMLLLAGCTVSLQDDIPPEMPASVVEAGTEDSARPADAVTPPARVMRAVTSYSLMPNCSHLTKLPLTAPTKQQRPAQRTAHRIRPIRVQRRKRTSSTLSFVAKPLGTIAQQYG